MSSLTNNLIIDRCPHCKIDKPNLYELWRGETKNHAGKNHRFWCVYKCATCGGLVLASSTNERGDVKEVYPRRSELETKIPKKPKEFLKQAIDTLHSPAGSVMLSASSVDAMLKLKGYKEGSLFSRINQAAEDNLITDEMAKWAHEIRLEANDQRHADEEADLPEIDEANRCIDFATALAQFLFVLPERVNKGIEDAKGKIEVDEDKANNGKVESIGEIF